jgi:hypothetical protein
MAEQATSDVAELVVAAAHAPNEAPAAQAADHDYRQATPDFMRQGSARPASKAERVGSASAAAAPQRPASSASQKPASRAASATGEKPVAQNAEQNAEAAQAQKEGNNAHIKVIIQKNKFKFVFLFRILS